MSQMITGWLCKHGCEPGWQGAARAQQACCGHNRVVGDGSPGPAGLLLNRPASPARGRRVQP